MGKGRLDKRARRALDERIDDISLLNSFYTKSGMEDVRFTSIERMDDLELTGGVNIPDIMVAERNDGSTDIFNKYLVQDIEPSVLDEIEVRGMSKEKALVLIEDGMQPDQILQVVSDTQEQYPGLDDESMLAMIQAKIEPELLAGIETMGLTAVPMEDGSVRVQGLAKIAEVDAEGKTVLSPKIKEQLAVFEQMGMIELSKEMAIEKIEPQERDLAKSEPKVKSKSALKSLAKAQGEEQEEEQDLAKEMEETQELQEQEEEELETSEEQVLPKKLKIVSLKEKNKVKTQDELEKEQIAKVLGCKPDDIISVIRFSSRETASQFFNDNVGGDTTQVLVRLSGNKFWSMEEDKDKNLKKRHSLEVSPASKLLADKLKDTRHPGDTWVLPGEMRTGKSHENSEKYDFFEVAIPGENKTDGLSSAMYVGLDATNTQDMRVLSSRRNNVYDIEEDDVRSIVPSRVFLPSNSGARDEIKVRPIDGEMSNDNPEVEQESSSSLKDLSEQQDLLMKLEYIEREIDAIEKANGISYNTESTIQDMEAEGDSKKRRIEPGEIADIGTKDMIRLPDLYAQRSEILTRLGLNESSLIRMPERTKEEEEQEAIRGEKRPH